MSKKIVMSIIMALALALAGGSYFSAYAMGKWTDRDMDQWKKEPMKVYQHSAATDGTDYGQPLGHNLYAPDNAKNSASSVQR